MTVGRHIQKKETPKSTTVAKKNQKKTAAELRAAAEEEEEHQQQEQSEEEEEEDTRQQQQQSEDEKDDTEMAKKARKIRKQEKREKKHAKKKAKKEAVLNAIYGDRKFLLKVNQRQQEVLREHPLSEANIKNLLRLRLTKDAEKQVATYEPDFDLEKAREVSEQRTQALTDFRRQQQKRFDKWYYGVPVKYEKEYDPKTNKIIKKTKLPLAHFAEMTEEERKEEIAKKKAVFKAEYEAFKAVQPEDTYKPKIAEYRKRIEAEGVAYLARAGEEVIHIALSDCQKIKKWETSKKKPTLKLSEVMAAIDVNPTFHLVTGQFIKEQEQLHKEYMDHRVKYEAFKAQQDALEKAKERVEDRKETLESNEEELAKLENTVARREKRKAQQQAEEEEQQENTVNTKTVQQKSTGGSKRKAAAVEEEDDAAPAPAPVKAKKVKSAH